ncbi:hypothetical protein DFH06DRAFT_1395296 [Mycena polygramma]|nr:hypothetical protein DFH06DRAFT_1395296 [Mycena polygramma]
MPRTSQVTKTRCRWCNTDRDGRGFSKHEEACKTRYLIEHQTARKKSRHARPDPEDETGYSGDTGHPTGPTDMDVDMDGPEPKEPAQAGPDPAHQQPDDVSKFYIKTVPHPHNEGAKTSYIALDGGAAPDGSAEKAATVSASHSSQKPWAPFRTRADFEYAESVVLSNMPRKWVDAQLAGINGDWSNTPSNITFRNYDHMEKSLAAARKYVVQFQTGEVEADFQGKTYKFEFQYRDPWKWIVDLLSDPTLANDIHWYPAQKFLCENGVTSRLFDEPYTADKWWRIQCKLPHVPGMPHCYIPILLWLDKGMVTKRVRKHPVMLRLLSLDGNIRNASGNGGGVLIAYMVIPIDPSDSSDRNAAQTIDWARFKREIMHKVFKIIFATLLKPAKHGEALTCGDDIERVCYPGIPITSIDGEEACSVSACRAALAHYPCPRCLVHHDELDKICQTFTARTTETMQQFYEDAITAPTRAEREQILQSVGLHATENFFWSFPNSDPYDANAYELLHYDESGKFGKHQWPLTLDVLKARGFKGRLTINMAKVPRWKNLKHFSNVTTEEYTDGQAFLDILKCILPCIVQLLDSNSALVNCLRAYQLYRFNIGLKCSSKGADGRIERGRKYRKMYEKYCKRVETEHGKDFKFYKQHQCAHVFDDITNKGVPTGYSTRPGEGFHQEVKEAFEQTNFKNTDPQLARIDENKEAFARIRMAVDEYDTLRSTEDVGEDYEDFDREGSDLHWSLGSPLKWVTAETLQHELKDRNFAANLRTFLNEFIVDEALQPDQTINIKPYRCIRLRYQSCEDWTEETDILRCNPNFHHNPRYDHVLVNDTPDDLSVARLASLLRCKLPDESVHDIAFVHRLKRSKWKSFDFVMVKYLIRGAHMIPVFDANKPSLTFLNDVIDGDMFLRAGN